MDNLNTQLNVKKNSSEIIRKKVLLQSKITNFLNRSNGTQMVPIEYRVSDDNDNIPLYPEPKCTKLHLQEKAITHKNTALSLNRASTNLNNEHVSSDQPGKEFCVLSHYLTSNPTQIAMSVPCSKTNHLPCSQGVKSLNTSYNEPKTTNSLNNTPKTATKNKPHKDTNKENATPKTSRAWNEISAASLLCPVLIRDPPKCDLREALNALGIYRNLFKRYNFANTLEEIGENLVQKFVSGEEGNSFFSEDSMRICMYCGFRTESRLALGHHLHTRHKNKFRMWPYCQRMCNIDPLTSKYKTKY